MVNLEMILSAVAEGVMCGDSRFKVIDKEHVMDTMLSVEYHIYPQYENKPFKITKGGIEVLSGSDLTPREAGILSRLGAYLQHESAEKNRKSFHNLYNSGVNKQDNGNV